MKQIKKQAGGYLITIIILLTCILLTIQTFVFSSKLVGASSSMQTTITSTEIVIFTSTSTPLPTPTPLNLYSAIAGECSYDNLIKPILDDAKQLSIPITPIPTVPVTPEPYTCPTSTVVEPTPTTSLNYISQIGVNAILDAHALDAAMYFKDHQSEGIAGLQKWLEDQKLLCVPNPCPNNLIELADGQSNIKQYAMTISTPSRYPTQCGAFEHAFQRVYLLSCQPNSNHCDVHRVGRLWENAEDGACINAVTDLNQDGLSELLVTYHQCGASNCVDRMEIVGLDKGVRYLSPQIEAHNGCISGQDEDADGKVEILVRTSEQPGSIGFHYDDEGEPLYGPSQGRVSIYQWDGLHYRIGGRAYTHDCLYHVIWDGVDWFNKGQIETSLAIFEIALTNQDIPAKCGDEKYRDFPWQTYAQYAVGMLNARLGRNAEARNALLKAKELDEEQVFTPLVDTFLETYDVGCYTAACEALNDYISTSDETSVDGPYGNRRLVTFCPDNHVN
ncbi:MAG: hypothetical protein GY797_29240 [Deltaproteobacteria bacterium]|nr:hypothetical protein [Deltaproteobacteria bacterium]